MKPLFRRPRAVPADHPPFGGLAVDHIVTRNGRTRVAVHCRGRFAAGRMPLVCVPGYNRNMSDFIPIAEYSASRMGGDWPLVLIDLPGRGRADDRPGDEQYGSLADARDLADTVMALGLGRVALLGQGHGGQVAMAFAAAHPLLVGGTILLDAGPVTDSRGIVRLRNNLAHIDTLRGAKTVTAGFRRILAGDYPGRPDAVLDPLALRSHWFDKRGRARPLFDTRLIERLRNFDVDHVLTPQWTLYEALRCAPLMLLRTQLTDQLRRETFEEMRRRRPDAPVRFLADQGSPALFDQVYDLKAITDFVAACEDGKARTAA
jgi:pimeloyl-ACP methyl ester carboxylesterase